MIPNLLPYEKYNTPSMFRDTEIIVFYSFI